MSSLIKLNWVTQSESEGETKKKKNEKNKQRQKTYEQWRTLFTFDLNRTLWDAFVFTQGFLMDNFGLFLTGFTLFLDIEAAVSNSFGTDNKSLLQRLALTGLKGYYVDPMIFENCLTSN